MDGVNECVIEWLRGEKVATVTMPSNTPLNTKLRKLAEKGLVTDWFQNKDGSIVAHVPARWIKITPPRELSDEQRAVLSERMKNMRAKKENKDE